MHLSSPIRPDGTADPLYAFVRESNAIEGNGRSGRVLWAWQMGHMGSDPFVLPFLHTAYYQALEAGR